MEGRQIIAQNILEKQKMREQMFSMQSDLYISTVQRVDNITQCVQMLIDLSRIPVNKGTNSRLGWTKYSDLYEIVHPSLVFISLCLLTGA